MAINSNAFAGEVPPKLDPPSIPQLPVYARDAERMQQAATAAALEKAVSAATNHAKQVGALGVVRSWGLRVEGVEG